MRDAIKNTNKQFAFQPKIEFSGSLAKRKKFLLCGMGGSHIPGDVLKLIDPSLDMVVWSDYGLPPLKDLKERLVIACSYSGNTEEAVDNLATAKRLKLRRAVLTTGGKLLQLAQKEKTPYVRVPNTGIQPRMGTAFMLRALMKLIGDTKGLKESALLEKKLDPMAFEAAGKALARSLEGSVPVIYSSNRNWALAWNWKIKFAETGKIPAFMSVFPELNHNDMNGFDPLPSNRALSKPFHFLMLEDAADHERVRLRFKVTKDLYRARGLKSTTVPVEGDSIYLKIFSSLLLADWTAFYTALHYGAEAEKVPMVEDFKTRLK